jgi:release factor glutamine methyltransferase
VSGADLWNWLQTARHQAIATDEIDPLEADWLLQEFTPLSALDLRLGSFQAKSQIPSERSLTNLEHLWQQRIQQRTPIQYLAGRTPWRNFSLHVSPAVLIPRPETELLIDLGIAAIRDSQSSIPLTAHPCHWADLGTGSGAIALGLAHAFPQATIHAVDQSHEALAIARSNAQRYNLGDRIHFYPGNWFAPLQALKGKLSGMVSNPPYIPSQTVLGLQPEVCNHEPHLALDGGADGLDAIRHLVDQAPAFLQPGGIWLIEMMAGQAPAVTDLLMQNGNYRAIAIHKDLSGIARFALAYRI